MMFKSHAGTKLIEKGPASLISHMVAVPFDKGFSTSPAKQWSNAFYMSDTVYLIYTLSFRANTQWKPCSLSSLRLPGMGKVVHFTS